MPFAPLLSQTMPAAYVLAQLFSCTPVAPPVVDITFNNKPYTINNNVSVAQLQQVQTNTHIAKSATENFTTVGTTASNILTDMDVGFQMLSNPVSGKSCLSLSRVRITMTYTPEVLILRDYTPSSCRYKITYDHELRHVNTDILTVHDFMPIIRDALQKNVNILTTKGPIAKAQVTAEQEKMQKSLQSVLTSATDQMAAVRQARQQQVDTREEYLRLSAACPNEPITAR